MIKPNRNGKYPVDLSTVAAVRIANEWQPVLPGTFTLGEPVYFIPRPDTDGGGAWVYGGRWHPLSYFFTHADTGITHTGPLDAIQQMTYSPDDPAAPDKPIARRCKWCSDQLDDDDLTVDIITGESFCGANPDSDRHEPEPAEPDK